MHAMSLVAQCGAEWSATTLMSKFDDLVTRFGERHGLSGDPPLSTGRVFEFGGVAMSLRYQQHLLPYHAIVAVDFGPAQDAEASELRSLLEANVVEFGTGAMYGIAPHTGHVVCFATMALEKLDVDGLEQLLGELADASVGVKT